MSAREANATDAINALAGMKNPAGALLTFLGDANF